MVVNHGIWGGYPIANPELANRWTWKVRTKSLMHSFLSWEKAILRQASQPSTLIGFSGKHTWTAHRNGQCFLERKCVGKHRESPPGWCTAPAYPDNHGIHVELISSKVQDWDPTLEPENPFENTKPLVKQSPVHLWFMLEYGLVPYSSAIPLTVLMWIVDDYGESNIGPPSNTKF